MKRGYVRLYRKTLDCDVWKHDKNAWLIFMYLLMKVDRETGSYDTGRFALAEQINMKSGTTYKALKRLEKAKMVTLASNNKYTKITVSNWKEYQPDNTNGNNTVTTGEQPGNNTVTLNKKRELRIKNRDSVSEKIEDFQIQFPKIDVPHEWEKCVDYYVGKGKQVKDWQATFRNWLRSEIPKKMIGSVYSREELDFRSPAEKLRSPR